MQVLISATTKGLNAGLQQGATALKGFQDTISKTNNLLATFGVGFGLFQVTRAIGDAVNILKDFDQQMAVVKAITGATGAEFEELRQNAISLGQSTKFTATEIGSLQENLAKLGFTTPEILAATKGITALSVATGEDLAKSADVVGSTIRSFGLLATDTGRVVDVMAESFNRTALGLENFTEAIKYVAPIAAQAGLSIEETTALLGVLADNGIRGSQAGTSLRKIITDLGTESGDLSTRLEKLAAKGLTGADAMSEVGRTAYASLLILSKNTEKSEELTNALNNVAGAADKTAAIVGDTLAGDLDKLSSAYDSLILSGSDATSSLREVTQATTGFVNALAEEDNAFGQFLDFFADIISIVPRAANAVANFFSDEGLSAQELTEKLTELNKVREFHKQQGNRQSELFAIREIAELTNKYKLLTPAVEESNKVIATSTGEIKKLSEVLVPPIGLIQGIENRLKELEEKKKAAFSVGEIQNLNQQIDVLKGKLIELNASVPLSGFGQKQLENAIAGIDTNVPAPTLEVENLFPTQIPVPDIAPAMAALQTYTAAVQASGASAIKSIDAEILHRELLIESEQRRAEMAIRVGEIIGDSVGDVLSGQKTLVQGFKQATAELLKVLLARALGGIISGAATTGAPPPIAIALATAGVAAISALFKAATGVGKSVSGGGSGPSLTNVNRLSPVAAQEAITIEGEFTLYGNNQVAIATSEQNRLRRLGR